MLHVSLVVLIRHSLPAIDLSTPAAGWGLSAEGRRRCEVLARRLVPYGIQAVISSTYPKARETADLVGRALGLPVSSAAGLQEQDRSRSVEGGAAAYESALARTFACPDLRILGNESAHEALDRFRAALHGVLDRHARGTVAVVTHGTVLSLYVAERERLDALLLWRRLGMPCYAVLRRPDLRLIELVDDVGPSA